MARAVLTLAGEEGWVLSRTQAAAAKSRTSEGPRSVGLARRATSEVMYALTRAAMLGKGWVEVAAGCKCKRRRRMHVNPGRNSILAHWVQA
jgi:hypothetical protein